MERQHHYELEVNWTGNKGPGTIHVGTYGRNHTIVAAGKPVLSCSSDPAFRGDKSKYNPEELFLASLSACHMLWYLHLCADAGVVVESYTDKPAGVMVEESTEGKGRFTGVVLRPVVRVAKEEMCDTAMQLHEQARDKCFIANSCNFPVGHEAAIMVA